MSKAEELAQESEALAEDRLEREGYDWSVDADVQLRRCAAELRRLAALEKAIMDAEPVAWIVEGQTMGGSVSQYLAWKRSGAGQVPAPLRTDPTPLYTLNGIKKP